MVGWSDSFDLTTYPSDGVKRLLASASRIAHRAGHAVDGSADIHLDVVDSQVELLADGSFLGLEAAIDALGRELPIVADTLASERDEPALVALGDVIVIELRRGVGDLLTYTEDVFADTPARPAAPTLPSRPGAGPSADRVVAYRAAVLAALSGVVEPPTVLEEIHSTIESLLRALLAKPEFSFPGLVDQSVETGLLDEVDREPLRSLNKRRVAAKHHGSAVTIDDAFHHYLATFPAVVALATKARKAADGASEGAQTEPE